jgi:hypothetical protein
MEERRSGRVIPYSPISGAASDVRITGKSQVVQQDLDLLMEQERLKVSLIYVDQQSQG